MRKKDDACQIWTEICNNCESHEQKFAGSYHFVWEGTFKYIEKASNPDDKF